MEVAFDFLLSLEVVGEIAGFLNFTLLTFPKGGDVLVLGTPFRLFASCIPSSCSLLRALKIRANSLTPPPLS